MKTYTRLLFDLDETLLDFKRDSRAAFTAAMEGFGLPAGEEAYAAYQVGNHHCWQEFEADRMSAEVLRVRRFELFLKQLSLKHVSAEELGRAYMKELSTCAHLVAGARQTIAAASQTLTLAIVTNGLREAQRSRLQSAGLTSYFSAIVVSDEIGLRKPQAAYFRHTLAALGHPAPSTCLVIGDSLRSDIRGGAGAGMDTCWFNRAGKLRQDGDAVPTYEVDDHVALQALLGLSVPAARPASD